MLPIKVQLIHLIKTTWTIHRKGKDSELCKLLSYLQYNLYIKSSEKIIPPQFTHLFEEVYSISELEHLSNFVSIQAFLTPLITKHY